MRARPRALASAALLLAAGVVTGCAPVAADLHETDRDPSSTTTAVAATNCGHPIEFPTTPERVITIKSTATEMLLALGLGERIIGTAFQDGPLPSELDSIEAPVLAERMPSQEVVLDAEPDLVYSGWESAFQPESAGARDDLEALGVRTYVSPSACQSAEQPEQLGFEEIWSDVAELGAIFGVDASALIDEQRATVEAIRPDAAGRSALWFSSGSDTPYVGAGIGAPQLVLDTIGLRNIAADVPATWASFNWEAVVDANPEVIVLVDSAWNSAERKITVLEGNPATARMDAVVHGRYLVVPFAASEAGVRTAWAAADLAGQLAALE